MPRLKMSPKLANKAAANGSKEIADTAARNLDLSYLESTIGYAIRRAQLAVFQDIYRGFGELSITAVQFSVLAVVSDNPGTNQADLAAALGVERPRIVPVLDALEARSLAVRKPAPNDRRHRLLFLTEEGQAMLRELKKRFAVHQARMIRRLNVESAESLLNDLWLLAGDRDSSDCPGGT
ncbi:MarR family winged helix-turn-helix transcriptional regulator [Agrobacterium sp. CCNWLW71]|uniref:MarR family winged helix-turn-helix transcriptional regulator n=1 Tax=unclassified Agrobacterium TaxID=2632611 RepID=UPI002FF369C6